MASDATLDALRAAYEDADAAIQRMVSPAPRGAWVILGNAAVDYIRALEARLREVEANWNDAELALIKVGERRMLASTYQYMDQHIGDILEEYYQRHPDMFERHQDQQATPTSDIRAGLADIAAGRVREVTSVEDILAGDDATDGDAGEA